MHHCKLINKIQLGSWHLSDQQNLPVVFLSGQIYFKLSINIYKIQNIQEINAKTDKTSTV